jgi:hypothetical protein
LLRNFDAGDTRLPALVVPLSGPGQKVDWNNMHAVGTDYTGANWDYPEASYDRRRDIEKAHETYIRGFFWTMANNPRVPEAIRKKTASYGLPKDEFTDNGGWPWMIYIREARRMVSDYVMTQHDCEGKRKTSTPIALGSFGMDSHTVQHFVTERGFCISDGVIWRVPPRPYGIAYQSIIPKKGECENLFVPICLSASHVAHGSIRMEPVFMVMSQSAAIAAGLAIDRRTSVQDVSYAELRTKLEAAKQILQSKPAKGTSEPKKPASPIVQQVKPAPIKAEVIVINDHKAYLHASPVPAEGRPWVWYAPIVKGDVIIARHKYYFDAMINAGIAVAGYDLGEVRGSSASNDRFTQFYDEMVKRGYSKTPILLGQSRGGIMTLAWAVRNPDKVRAWAGIYPVCNLASYPMKSSKKETLADYGMTEPELIAKLSELNPIEHLAGLAKAKVPMFAVHGDKDGPVPLDDNTKVLKSKYEAAGGACEVKVIAGGRHEVTPAFFECQELMDFILKHAPPVKP